MGSADVQGPLWGAAPRDWAEIAERLHLSPRTVEKHIESLLRKTAARSRTQLATLADQSDNGAP